MKQLLFSFIDTKAPSIHNFESFENTNGILYLIEIILEFVKNLVITVSSQGPS